MICIESAVTAVQLQIKNDPSSEKRLHTISHLKCNNNEFNCNKNFLEHNTALKMYLKGFCLSRGGADKGMTGQRCIKKNTLVQLHVFSKLLGLYDDLC